MRNNLLDNFIQTLESRFSDDASSMAMSEWIIRNTSLKKRPFSFHKYEFQKRITDDLHPNLAVIKISQVGLTEVQFRKFFAFLRRNVGTTGIFTMPTETMRDRVSQTRVRPMIDADDVFNPDGVEKPIRQKGLIQVDSSFGYLTGSSETDATSIAADILFTDELDLTDQSMVALFQSRLQGSTYKITQNFSTPTYTGYGIDALYSTSDQHEYFYRCPHCNHHQIPTFTPNFVHLAGLPSDASPVDLSSLSIEQILSIDHENNNSYWKCEKCHSRLDLTDPSLREWVPRYPGRPTRGYRVRPTTVSTITVPYVLTQLQNYIRLDNLKGFKNTVLGEPYDDSSARLSEADIRAVMQSPAEPEIPPYAPCFIGIDVGITCHLILSTHDTTVFFKQVHGTDLANTISELMLKYNIICGCIDRYPDTTLSEQIKSITNGKIIPIHYATAPNAPTIKQNIDIDGTVSHWNAHRTRAIDEAVNLIRRHQLKLNGYGSFGNLIVSHLRDMVRVENADTPPVWNKVTGQDHFFHALTYLAIARRASDVDFMNPNHDRRSHCFVVGIPSSPPAGLSPSSLNKQIGQDLILGAS